ncbi:MAG: DUF881 domain-containing protein [Bifidobacteriaceae bacterium]|jgi:uncharacterized protein YlxW (UPF0749 family)|nr:DUF881 domain-containing protein [Bifidobacteriaceae bacterium]
MRRPDESMTLLTEVLERPLDGGYAEAAQRKAAGQSPVGPVRWALVAAIALVLGLAVTWGVRELRSPGEEAQRARQGLERGAAEAQERVTALRERTSELAGEVEALENQALSQMDPTAAVEARALAIAVGAIAVTGPGLEISIQEDVEAVAAGANDARIRAGDLRLIVGALWQSGAEGISVGGVRLASTTAVRDVGDQIQVGFESLGTPYVIQAIGPAEDMELGLVSGAAADRISLLKGYLGATVGIRRVDRLELPASAEVSGLDYITVGEGSDGR